MSQDIGDCIREIWEALRAGTDAKLLKGSHEAALEHLTRAYMRLSSA